MPGRGQSPQRPGLCPIPSGFIQKLSVHPREMRVVGPVRRGDFQVCDALRRETRNPGSRCSIWRRRRRSTASSGGFNSGADDVFLALLSLECSRELGWIRGLGCDIAPNLHTWEFVVESLVGGSVSSAAAV